MPDAKNLIYELMRYDPIDRIDASDAVNHIFFRNILLNNNKENNGRAKRDPKIAKDFEYFYVSITKKVTFIRDNCN